MLKVKSLLPRTEVKFGDVIAYPEGNVAMVRDANTSDDEFVITRKVAGKRKVEVISKYGQDLTYYGNLFEMDIQSRVDYESLEAFKVKKLSGEI